MILVWFVPWLALLVLNLVLNINRPYVFLIYLINLPVYLFSPVVWATYLVQMVGETQNRLLRGRNLPTPANYQTKAAYRLPFQGFWWVAKGGLDPETSHSWELLGQRYAYDFLIKDDQGKTHRGNGRRPEDYYAFGAPI